MLEQCIRERIQLAAILLEQRNDLLMRFLDDAAHFGVDELLRIRRDLGGTRKEWALAVTRYHCNWTDRGDTP